MSEKLYCGASRKCITPPADLLPHLYGLKGQSFGGVLDDLFLRVLALKKGETTLLLVSYDLDKAPYPREWIEALAQQFGLLEENISYSAIHTHTAPITGPRFYDGPNRKSIKSHEQQEATNRYEDYLFGVLTEAVQEALSSMQVAKFGYACTESYVNTNRNVDYPAKDGGTDCSVGNNGSGDVDHTLFLARFETESGSPIAFFMNYAVHNCVMHCNTMFDGKLAISSDLGGNISQKLEEQHPGAVALWTSGAAGDVNPVLMNEICYPSVDDGTCVTEQLGGDQTLFLRILTGRHYMDVTRALQQIKCDQESPRLAGCIQWISTPGRKFPNEEELPESLRAGEKDPDYTVRLQGLRIGEVAICGVSGELYTSFARQIQGQSPFERTLIVNHTACQMANSNYILDDDAIARDALGYNHSFIRPGYVTDALREASVKLFSELGKTE